MRSSKKWIRIPIIIAVTVCLLIALDFLLYPCTFIRSDIHRVTHNSFDDIYLGSSHGMSNIDPASVEKASGRTGHNLCVGSEYSVDAYYMAKLLLEKGRKPKRVVYEVSPGYFTKAKEEGNSYLQFYHEFPVTRAKAAYFKDCVARCNLRTVFFPWYEIALSEELRRMPETVRKKVSRDYGPESFQNEEQAYHENGFIEKFPRDDEDKSLDGLEELFPEDILETNMDYLSRLIDLCADNDIEFVAIMTPLPDETLEAFADGYAALDEYFSKYFDSKHVRFINFNDEEHYALTDHDGKHYIDLDGHMNGNAARAFSQVLAAQLDAEETGEIKWEDVLEEYDNEDKPEDDGLVG